MDRDTAMTILLNSINRHPQTPERWLVINDYPEVKNILLQEKDKICFQLPENVMRTEAIRHYLGNTHRGCERR